MNNEQQSQKKTPGIKTGPHAAYRVAPELPPLTAGGKTPYHHYHIDEVGVFVKCYHKSRSLAKPVFYWTLATMLAFPFEHYVWTHVWPFRIISEWLH